MPPSSVLPATDFTRAKATLSDLVTAAVHQQVPQLISRHGGKEQVVVLRPDLLVSALAAYQFEPEVVFGQDEVIVRLERFGILAAGAAFEEALADAVQELRAYAHEYFADWPLYSRTDRRSHLPWLLRFALTPDDQQAALLTEPPLPVRAAA